MSYCRFSEGDVYAYACEGGVQFWVTGKTLDRLCNTYDAAYQYAKYLRDGCGLDVPSHAIEALKADSLEEASHGDGSAVAELVSENAKLRELAEKAWKAAEMLCQAWDGPCHADGVSIKPPCPLDERDELCVYGLIQCELRELGIEVK